MDRALTPTLQAQFTALAVSLDADWLNHINLAAVAPAAVFEADLTALGEAFPLLLLAMGTRFIDMAQPGSRLYCRARVDHLLRPDALQDMSAWIGQDGRFAHLLPGTSTQQTLLNDLVREYPLPFLASQRLILAQGQIILDLYVEHVNALPGDRPIRLESLNACRVQRKQVAHQPRVAILGSGLAGCNLAAALAARGAKVNLFEIGPRPHAGASGNRQGALYIKPALAWSRENRLHVLSYQFAHRFYQRLFGETSVGPESDVGRPWQHCGVLHLAQNVREQQRMSLLHEQASYPDRFIRPLSAEEATRLSGTSLDCPAAAMPQGGTIEPARLCEHLLATYGIPVLTRQQISDSDWDAVVWAGGHPQAGDALAPGALPLRPIRGQISSLRLAAGDHETLALVPRQVLSGDGYVMPPLSTTADSVWLTFGASYAVNRSDMAISETEKVDNSRQLGKTLPALDRRLTALMPERDERAAIRCASTDYMPVVGQARLSHLGNFSSVKGSAVRGELARTFCEDGKLWFMTAFGSKGLALAPLLAEQLACRIMQEPPPLEDDLGAACDPERWARRAAAKGYSPSTDGTG